MRSSNYWLGKNYDYKIENNKYLSLPCPANGCEYGDFPNF